MHDSADRSGSALGDYILERLLGRGAMGEVYQARDQRRGRTVALKLLAPQFAGDAMFRERFLRESRTAAQLNDPHVIPIHDWGEINGYLFLDMRIVEGGSDLRGLLATGPLTGERAVSIIEQVAQALDAAHSAGLVHRDVKPDNILIDDNDFAYLVDFGLAQTTTDPRLTETGAAVGSFAYMAPERFGAGNIATAATDIYALTCVLVETLTGRAPFGAGDLQILVAAHLNQPPPMLGSPFDAIIARGMAKNPLERFATAGELAQAARDVLEGRVGAVGVAPNVTGLTPIPPLPIPPSGVPGAAAHPGAPMPTGPRILPPIVHIPPVGAANASPMPTAGVHPGMPPGVPNGPADHRTRNAVVIGAVVFVILVVILVAVLVGTLA